ncbi:response regulator [Marinicrinis lubricantis]|uniref:Response regulator n=1 Tax=Marinicrinis lubricantis TaxID=2086470 RepID=A0ABW1IT07_9BACL
MSGTVLVIEDDEDIMEMICLYLQSSGYTAIPAINGEEAAKLFATKKPDLVLTDIMLPDASGMEVTRSIRELSDVPIIMMSCKKESHDIVNGLDAGADDYITKPFDPNVVIARIRSQLRRYRHAAQSVQSSLVWEDDYLKIDPVAFKVYVEGRRIHLFAKEMKLLLLLLAHQGQVFHVEQLYEQVWGWDKSSDVRTVMVHIRNLRKKIERDPANPQYIVTVRGFGYKFGL